MATVAALLAAIQGGCGCNDESAPRDAAVDSPDDQVWDYQPVPRPPGLVAALGEYDPDYGFPAPQWFQDLEVITSGTNHELDGQLEFSHSAGGFQAARDGYYAAGSYADAGLAQRRQWNAMGSRVSTYQDSPRFGIIEHDLGIEWCVENYGEDWYILEDRWYAGQQGWPGKYVNKDGHEEAWNLYDENGEWIWKPEESLPRSRPSIWQKAASSRTSRPPGRPRCRRGSRPRLPKSSSRVLKLFMRGTRPTIER